MTVVSKTADLTKAINATVKELEVTQASLDAQVTTATGYATTAATHQATAEGYRDTTATHAASVAADLATVQGNVTYQGIEAILAEKAVTAVDVFVYDTSLDSDGGAWRKRCQHTSWHNEELNTATRGARREFPAVAVIVVEADRATIYDGDDPSLPMWMLFMKGGTTAERNIIGQGADVLGRGIRALNGMIVSATTTRGIRITSFVEDASYLIDVYEFGKYKSNLANRNANSGFETLDPAKELVSNNVNDVAMTVLPDAPVDPATGLPVPTIAVGCGITGQPNGGTSIIKHDGTVIDIRASGGAGGYACFDLGFGRNGQLVTTQSYNRSYGYVHIFDELPTVDIPGTTTPGGARTYSYGVGFPSVRGSLSGGPNINDIAIDGEVVSFALSSKLSHLLDDGATKAKSMVAYAASKYTSGWLVGNIRGAFLADTDDTDLTSSELVVNGTFDADADWILGANTSISGGTLNFNWTTFAGMAQQPVLLKAGRRYRLRYDVTAYTSGSFRVYLGAYITGTTSAISVDVFFTPSADVTNISLQGDGNGFVGSVDNFSITEADHDRSVNNKGLIVNGSITRSPVATGAELVGYSGFSAANYLEQPYNSALDFGTGDFCVMGWHKKPGSNTTGGLIKRLDAADSGAGFNIYHFGYFNTTVTLFNGAGGSKTITATLKDGWQHVCAVRKGDVLSLYSDGVLAASVTGVAAYDLSNVNGILKVGSDGTGSVMALWRLSATAPTPDQIAKIYEDERKLFQPGAQCTLYGTSDAVTALAHDPKTNLLHVGTSAGRSTFDGLVRVANTTTPVGTAISAVNGLIVEE